MDGGFIVEDEAANYVSNKPSKALPLIPPQNDPNEQPECIECHGKFPYSFLYSTFEFPVCDACKDTENKHKLITRTDAKAEYLLKDCDFDLREPPLRFICKKNPHNSRWGDMKLYCRPQVEARALLVWDSLDALAKARQERVDARQKLKAKRFEKKLSNMRKAVRTDLKSKTAASVMGHTHDFGPEKDLGNDVFQRKCKSCGFCDEFEKM